MSIEVVTEDGQPVMTATAIEAQSHGETIAFGLDEIIEQFVSCGLGREYSGICQCGREFSGYIRNDRPDPTTCLEHRP